MKKKYFSPSIQKVSFRYRDQVVAASGDPTLNNPDSGTQIGGNNGYWGQVWEFINGVWQWFERWFG